MLSSRPNGSISTLHSSSTDRPEDRRAGSRAVVHHRCRTGAWDLPGEPGRTAGPPPGIPRRVESNRAGLCGHGQYRRTGRQDQRGVVSQRSNHPFRRSVDRDLCPGTRVRGGNPKSTPLPEDPWAHARAIVAAVSRIGSGFAATTAAAYTYDSLNRLTQAVLGDGRTIAYTWDAAGNLIQVTVSGQ